MVKDNDKLQYSMKELKTDDNIYEKALNLIKNKEVFCDDIDTLILIINSLKNGEHIVLYGPVGTGKTELARKIAELFECEYNITTVGDNWDSPEYLIGHNIFMGDSGFKYIEGPLLKSILQTYDNIINSIEKAYQDKIADKQATWLIIDEINRGDTNRFFSSLITCLEPLRTNLKKEDIEKKYYFEYIKNEEVKKIYIPKNFRIIGTMNDFDKNVLYKMPIALKGRRFAYIPINVPLDINREVEIIKNNLEKESLTCSPSLLNYLKDIIISMRKLNIQIGTSVYMDFTRSFLTMEKINHDSNFKDICDLSILIKLVPIVQEYPLDLKRKFSKYLNERGYVKSYKHLSFEDIGI